MTYCLTPDNIQNDTTASDWYNLQKNLGEVMPLALPAAHRC